MWDQKDNQRNNSWKSPNLGERHKPIVSRIRENPKYEKKKINPHQDTSQLYFCKLKTKGKNWKS